MLVFFAPNMVTEHTLVVAPTIHVFVNGLGVARYGVAVPCDEATGVMAMFVRPATGNLV